MRAKPVVDVDFRDGEEIHLSVPTATGVIVRNLVEELSWGASPDANEILEGHSGKEAWWNARQVDESSICAEWIETVYDPYMAHLRKFAIYALSGQGVRRSAATKQDIHDMLFQIYSEQKSNEQRERYARFAFLGYMVEQYESRAAVERVYASDRATYDAHYASFTQEIFAFQEPPEPVWMEEIIRRRIRMERSKELLGAASAAFHQRGFLLKQSAENEKVRRNTLGHLPIEDLAREVAQILRKDPSR